MMEESEDNGSEAGMDDSSNAPSCAVRPGGFQEDDTQSEATSTTPAGADPFDLLSMTAAPAASQPAAAPAGDFDVFGAASPPADANETPPADANETPPVADLLAGSLRGPAQKSTDAIDISTQESMIVIGPKGSSPKLVTAESGDLLGLTDPPASEGPPQNDFMDSDFQTMPTTAPAGAEDPFGNVDLFQSPSNGNKGAPMASESLLSDPQQLFKDKNSKADWENESKPSNNNKEDKGEASKTDSEEKFEQLIADPESTEPNPASHDSHPDSHTDAVHANETTSEVGAADQPESNGEDHTATKGEDSKTVTPVPENNGKSGKGADGVTKSDKTDKTQPEPPEEQSEPQTTEEDSEAAKTDADADADKANPLDTRGKAEEKEAEKSTRPGMEESMKQNEIPPGEEGVNESAIFEEVELVSPTVSGETDTESKMENEKLKAEALSTDALKPPLTTSDAEPATKSKDVLEVEAKAEEDQERRVQELEAQLAAAKKEVEDLQNQKKQIEQQHKDSQEETATVLQELESKLQKEQKDRAEAENSTKVANVKIQRLEAEMEEKEKQWEQQNEAWKEQLTLLEKENEALIAKAKQELEERKEHERRERVLANKLNTIKKQQASKTDVDEVYEDDLRLLKEDVAAKTKQIEELQASEAGLKQELEQERTASKARIESLETAVREEKQLNEDRKKKMKAFIETKAEELKEAKADSENYQAELSRNNQAMVDLNSRWKTLHAQWVQSQTRNRELQRDLNKIKKDSENLHKKGDSLNVMLSKSANETEQHKNKRLAAKQELMAVLAKLEVEREITNKLRDSIRFTFTAKAQSQHQLLQEALAEFKKQLEALATRLGKPIPIISDGQQSLSSLVMSAVDESEASASEVDFPNGTGEEKDKNQGPTKEQRRMIAETTRLLGKLESETQHISQAIMTLSSAIEQMNNLLNGGGEKTCFTSLGDIFFGGGLAKARNTSTTTPGGGRVRYGHSSTMPTPESGTMV